MKVRVEHEMMDNVVKTSSNDSESLFKEIAAIEENINSLKMIWKGVPADIYYKRIDNFLQNLKIVSESYNTFSKFMGKANGLYKEADENLRNEIRKIRDDMQ